MKINLEIIAMQRYNTPNCCGFSILAGFPMSEHRPDADEASSYEDSVAGFLDEQDKAHTEQLLPSNMLAILNSAQIQGFIHLFKERGWKVCTDPLYHRTANELVVLVKAMYPNKEGDYHEDTQEALKKRVCAKNVVNVLSVKEENERALKLAQAGGLRQRANRSLIDY
jgi:hypothetical protein